MRPPRMAKIDPTPIAQTVPHATSPSRYPTYSKRVDVSRGTNVNSGGRSAGFKGSGRIEKVDLKGEKGIGARTGDSDGGIATL